MSIAFSIESQQLLPALLILSGAVEKKQDNPILAHILFSVNDDSLDLSATDKELECIARIRLDSVSQTGRVAVPAKKLIDICRALEAKTKMDFLFSEGKLKLKIGRSRFTLSTLLADDFPIFKEFSKDISLSIEREKLQTLFQSTFFCMAQQDVRYFLNGLLFETSATKITTVSTDGHRLALSAFDISQHVPDKKVIIPRKAVSEFMKLLSSSDDEYMTLAISDKNIVLQSQTVSLISCLIEGAFPSYHSAFPSHCDKEVIVDKDSLKQSLLRVSVLVNEKARNIKLTTQDNAVLFTAENQEKDEAIDEIMVHTKGDSLTIGLNVSYLIEVLNNMPDGDVVMKFSTPFESILITSSSSNECRYVIMPVKI